MAAGTQTSEASQGDTGAEPLVHILWMNGGLGCDGDSVALTAATQPSIEEIALGALPGLPKIAVHWPLIDFECGPETGADNFIEWWHKADRGELEPWRGRSRTRRSSRKATGADSATTRPPGSR
jgi:hydrogenase small subunit